MRRNPGKAWIDRLVETRALEEGDTGPRAGFKAQRNLLQSSLVDEQTPCISEGRVFREPTPAAAIKTLGGCSHLRPARSFRPRKARPKAPPLHPGVGLECWIQAGFWPILHFAVQHLRPHGHTIDRHHSAPRTRYGYQPIQFSEWACGRTELAQPKKQPAVPTRTSTPILHLCTHCSCGDIGASVNVESNNRLQDVQEETCSLQRLQASQSQSVLEPDAVRSAASFVSLILRLFRDQEIYESPRLTCYHSVALRWLGWWFMALHTMS